MTSPYDEPVLPDQTRDDTDVGWSERDDDNDARLRDEVPPHHTERD